MYFSRRHTQIAGRRLHAARLRTRRSQDQERGQALARFGRDVTINLVANIIAAAMIYLFGVLIGFFPRPRYAVAAAVIIGVGAAGSAALLLLPFALRSRRGKILAVVAGLLVLLGSGFGLATATHATSTREGIPYLVAWIIVTTPISVAFSILYDRAGAQKRQSRVRNRSA